ncbi:response regulator transcription factor [Cellulosilyticum sp. I15G10I2]|uniref:response regulator transcription factor n=1 Tax=Cellulosilyticum sp. I15G10I2 TaxID=1892843 RepID=UPI00085C13D6|nr:response regulator [Cellulosilyticum sp. I15G10I2]
MYKVLIIDDEVLVRVGLKSTINWESIGFSIVGEASNGEKGYEQYKLHKPDVIITDIKMPHKDGMWLIKKIRETNKQVKILILTCYDEFEYVREALKLGADDYILKSEIEDEELIDSMSKFKAQLKLIPDKDKELRVLKEQFESNAVVLKAKLLEDLVNKNKLNEIALQNEYLKIQFPTHSCHFSFVTLIREDEKKKNEALQQNNDSMNDAIINLIYDICQNEKMNILANREGERFQFLLARENLHQNNVEQTIIYVQEKVMQYFNITLSGVYSAIFNNLTYLGEVVVACKIKEEEFFYTSGPKLLFTKVQEAQIEDNKRNMPNSSIFNLDTDFKKLIIKYIDEENIEKCKEHLEELAQLFGKYHLNSLEVKLFYSNLVNTLFEKYGQCFRETNYIKDYHYYYNLIINLNKMKELASLLDLFITDAVRSIKEYRVSNSKYVMKRAMEYIDAHYYNKISLEDIANYINLSKHYVSYLFKKETGINISAYINDIRIEKAKQMIVQREYKIKEIFEKVGFSDQQYFSKAFKKATGMTVTQYKESIEHQK